MSVATQPHRSVRPQPVVPEALRVSLYEKVASWFLALVASLGAIAVMLLIVWWGNRVTVRKVSLPIVPLVIEDAGGGYEHGVEGETIELPGPVTSELGVGSEPAQAEMEQTLDMVSEVVVAKSSELDDLQVDSPWSTGGIGGSRGTGNAPSLGWGGGSGGGVRRGLRWLIEFGEGGTLDNYARQLDFFKVELAAIGGSDEITYAFNLAQPAPTTRRGPAESEKRLYFSWREGSLRDADRQLMTRAGVDLTEKLIVQFYPPETENLLAAIEAAYLQENSPRRNIRMVRQTRFGVEAEGDGYRFFVKQQTYLR